MFTIGNFLFSPTTNCHTTICLYGPLTASFTRELNIKGEKAIDKGGHFL